MMQDEVSKKCIKKLITFFCIACHPFVRDVKHQISVFDCTADGIMSKHVCTYNSAMGAGSSL